jgi:hypothetical protein
MTDFGLFFFWIQYCMGLRLDHGFGAARAFPKAHGPVSFGYGLA